MPVGYQARNLSFVGGATVGLDDAGCRAEALRRCLCHPQNLGEGGPLGGRGSLPGECQEDGDRLKAIPFPRIAGGKPFDISAPWFVEMMAEIGQTVEPAGE